MLTLDAIAPVSGILSTSFFQVPPQMLSIYLGFFAGFLIHISISDILPEAHAGHRSTGLTILLTCLGAAFIFAVQAVMSQGGVHVH
jgi:ZIP family zinc transporter